jgi:hypothetical protein
VTRAKRSDQGAGRAHRGAVTGPHLDYYLDEFTFRFNRRRSRHRGTLFFRLANKRSPSIPRRNTRMLLCIVFTANDFWRAGRSSCGCRGASSPSSTRTRGARSSPYRKRSVPKTALRVLLTVLLGPCATSLLALGESDGNVERSRARPVGRGLTM